MRRKISRELALTLAAVVSVPALACTTFVVGKAASETGRVLLGHNEDDGGWLRLHAYADFFTGYFQHRRTER